MSMMLTPVCNRQPQIERKYKMEKEQDKNKEIELQENVALTAEEQQIDAGAEKLLQIEQAENNAEHRLDVIFGDEPIPEEPAKVEDPTPVKPEEKVSTPVDDKPAEEPEGDKPAGDQPKEEPKAAEEPKLTEAEIRAAKHSEWSDEDIKELVDSNPVLAKKTFAKLLKDENNLSSKFADIGRTLVKTREKPANKPAAEAPKKTELKKVDIEKLRKEYEGDPIVDVLEAVQANAQVMADELAIVKTSQPIHTDEEAAERIKQAQAREDVAVSQQIDAFFQTPDVTVYKDFYGEIPKEDKNWDNLTTGQIKNRWKIIEEANLILQGAAHQGMDMPLNEAFERAHLLATKDVREQAIRTKIKSEAKKREKGLTLEPSSSKTVQSPSVKTRQQAEDNAGKNLAKVFG